MERTGPGRSDPVAYPQHRLFDGQGHCRPEGQDAEAHDGRADQPHELTIAEVGGDGAVRELGQESLDGHVPEVDGIGEDSYRAEGTDRRFGDEPGSAEVGRRGVIGGDEECPGAQQREGEPDRSRPRGIGRHEQIRSPRGDAEDDEWNSPTPEPGEPVRVVLDDGAEGDAEEQRVQPQMRRRHRGRERIIGDHRYDPEPEHDPDAGEPDGDQQLRVAEPEGGHHEGKGEVEVFLDPDRPQVLGGGDLDVVLQEHVVRPVGRPLITELRDGRSAVDDGTRHGEEEQVGEEHEVGGVDLEAAAHQEPPDPE